ncbi:hypothetical protein WJX81_003967 [Elliptochloris bilobata]|uniref:Uncharacterized protein n=1 Tax=Elliptochloris bilobata TaxID=381761 RepID=A0AAW1SB48_9CHLO
MTDAVSKGHLKRLEFVRSYSGAALSKAGDVGTTLKQYLPASVKPHFEKAIDQAKSTASPAVAKTQDWGEQVLTLVDSKVDDMIVTGHRFYSSSAEELKTQVDRQRQFHEKNMEHYSKAREAYLKKIEETVEFLKKEGLTGTAKVAADTVMARVEDAKKLPGYVSTNAKVMLEKVSSAWDNLQEFPAVKKILNVAQPGVDFAWKHYQSTHDAVAGSPTYHKVWDQSQGMWHKLKSTSAAKKAEESVWPYISPYADPVIEKVGSSSYYQAAVNHLKPIAANGM